MFTFNPFCISLYLAFRYVAAKGVAWMDGVAPVFQLTMSTQLYRKIGIEREP